MTPFADRTRRAARWPALLGLMAPAALLAACSTGAPDTLVLREVVADWPPGLAATLAVVAAPLGDEVVLATTEVDAGGAFRLAVPAPAAALLVAVAGVYPDVPECRTELENPAARLLFVADLAITDAAGLPLGRLVASRVEPRGGRVASLSFVYADDAGSVIQACSFHDATFDVALDLRAGWNPFLIEASLGARNPHYAITTAAVPASLAWRYEERSDPALAMPAAAPTRFLAWATRQLPAEGRGDRR